MITKEKIIPELLFTFKLIRIFKLSSIRSRLHEKINSNSLNLLVYIIKSIATTGIISHIVACILIYSPQLYPNEFSWALDLEYPYIQALYLSVNTMTTVGYGDLHAFSTNDKLTNILITLVCCIFFAYALGRVQAVFDKYSEDRGRFSILSVHLMKYLKKN